MQQVTITRTILRENKKRLVDIKLLGDELARIRDDSRKKKLYDQRKRELQQLEAESAAVEKWIEKIENPSVRYVFYERYISGSTWAKIAAGLGYDRASDYPRLLIHDKYLEEKEIY